MVVVLAVPKLRQADGVVVAIAAFGAAALTFGILAWADRARWRDPVAERDAVSSAARGRTARRAGRRASPTPELAELTHEIVALARSVRPRVAPADGPPARPVVNPHRREPPAPSERVPDPERALRCAAAGSRARQSDPQRVRRLFDDRHGQSARAGRVSLDRVEPRRADFLGWTLDELRQKSFLDIVHPDDRRRAEETFGQALTGARPWA